MFRTKCSVTDALALIYRGPLWGLFLVVGIEIFGASLSLPVFAFFCIEELKLSAADIGFLASSFNLAQLVGSPAAGAISDTVGRRPVLLVCFAWSSAGFAATYFATSFHELLTIRVVAGLSGGSIGVAAAMVMDCTSPDERPRVLGMKGALLGLIVAVGPLLAACLLWFGIERRSIFLLSSVASLLGFIMGKCLLRESHLETHTALCLDTRLQTVLLSCLDIRRGLICAWLARFCATFSTWCMYVSYAFIIKRYFDWGDVEFAMLTSFASVFQGMMELFSFPIISLRFGDHGVCIAGMLVMAGSFALVVVPQAIVHTLGFAIFQLGQSWCQPGIVNLTAAHAPSDTMMGFVQGGSSFFKSLASVSAPLLAGWLFDVAPMGTYVLAAAFSMIGALTVFIASWGETASEKTSLLEGERRV